MNISEKTLTKWRDKGWLKPTSIPGTYPKYTEEAFEAACDMSLQAHYDEAMKQLDEATPNDQSVYRAAIA